MCFIKKKCGKNKMFSLVLVKCETRESHMYRGVGQLRVNRYHLSIYSQPQLSLPHTHMPGLAINATNLQLFNISFNTVRLAQLKQCKLILKTPRSTLLTLSVVYPCKAIDLYIFVNKFSETKGISIVNTHFQYIIYSGCVILLTVIISRKLLFLLQEGIQISRSGVNTDHDVLEEPGFHHLSGLFRQNSSLLFTVFILLIHVILQQGNLGWKQRSKKSVKVKVKEELDN